MNARVDELETEVAGSNDLETMQWYARERVAARNAFLDGLGALDPVAFDVRYRAESGERIHLGTFSLYPPDNPGRFIVATQGRVRGHGAIEITMVPLGIEKFTGPVRVVLGRISLRED